MKYLLLSVVALMFIGCASLSDVPQNSSSGFSGSEGVGGNKKQIGEYLFEGISKRKAFDVAKLALADAEFTVKSADFNDGSIIAEHGMTMWDWNIMAGVYLKEVKGGTLVRVVSQPSKELDFGTTNSEWPQKIFKKMRKYL